MKRYAHGLVPGRFCPPHAGHHHLVRTAADRCERLTVLVCGFSAALPLDDRIAWMREVHPGVQVVGALDDAPVDPHAPEGWEARLPAVLAAVPEPVDAVFTSEAYGEELGRRLGAEAVRVDPGHTVFPVSGRAVRKDPVGCWDFLEPPVRAALARRVVVLGAESTGTTTMAWALAEHYRRRGGVWTRTRFVPDHGQAFAEQKLAALRAGRPEAGPADVAFTSEEFLLVAQRQSELEEEAARAGSPVVFCDTDAFTTTIRHERYLGTADDDVRRVAARGTRHLWLVTDHRGVRAAGGATPDGGRLRSWMTARFMARLTRTGRRTVLLTGPHEQRLATAVAAVDALLAEGWDLEDTPPETR